MSTIAEFDLPAAEFALYDTLAGVDGVRFEVERVVAHDDRIMPFVWASGADSGGLDAALRLDSSVGGFETLADLGDERLYRMEWIERTRALVRLLVEERGTVLAASSSDDGVWHLRLLYPERAALSRTYSFCEEAGLDMDIVRVYDLNEGRQGRYGLTDHQQDALMLASKRGYYAVPREIPANELADELGISHQALSERLRRAHESLVENTIVLGRTGERRE